jgi:hypothetical protein
VADKDLEILLKAKNLTEEAFRQVERAVEQLEGKTKKSRSGLAGFADDVEGFYKSHEKSFKAVGQGLALAGAGVAAVAGGIVALGVRGTTVVGVEKSFNALAASIGDTGSEILKVTSKATKGLISDMDIMSAVNKGILLGLPLTSKEMGTLGETALILGRAMQRGPVDALGDLIIGLGRGSPLILDNLGITIDAAEANEKYAASLGKSAKELTDQERKLAVYYAALEGAKAKVQELGDFQLTFADRVQAGKVAVQNFTDSLSKAVATSPAINRAMEVIAGSVNRAFGGDSQALVKQIAGYIDSFAIGVVRTAQVGLEAGRVLVYAWDGLKILFAGVMVAISGVAEAFNKSFAYIWEAAA